MKTEDKEEILKEWDDTGDAGNVLLEFDVDIEELNMIIKGDFQHSVPYGQKIGFDGQKQWYNSTINPYNEYDSTVKRRSKINCNANQPLTRDCQRCGEKILQNERHICGFEEDDGED